ncbi:MAG TPA: pyridoxamine 5'-phosphate oxidase family protein [Hyphomicrobium sp.]|nr:pyridoxamine 5'-phosphate oxidase family protein [Hyphomicrobium sp.]
MTRLYGEKHRALQDAFDTRKLADRVEEIVVRPEIDDMGRAFVESRDMFFLSTVDHNGRPTVSYKGGTPGFVKVLDPTTIVFPSYDGNGMHYSTGNIAGNPEIGCLFIDFERPYRMRLQGRAELVLAGPLLSMFKEAEMVVKVAVTETWMNCPRYVHRYQKLERSRYAPGVEEETPFCEWKRIDTMQDTLRPKELEKVAEIGTITIDDWMGKVLSGDKGA